MARIEIDLPDEFIFSTKLRVRLSDISGGIHLANHILVSYLNEAATAMLKDRGFKEFLIDGYAIGINTDLIISYEDQAQYGDLLRIEVALGNFNKYGCDVFFKVLDDNSERKIATAKMGMVFIDYKSKKITTVPDVFKKTFGIDEIEKHKLTNLNL
jgi:YbgC/YbaW family acyl-CoA thioester hydrolase